MSTVYDKRIIKINDSAVVDEWNKVANASGGESYNNEKRSVINSTPESSSGIVSDDHNHTIFSDYPDTVSSTTHHQQPLQLQPSSNNNSDIFPSNHDETPVIPNVNYQPSKTNSSFPLNQKTKLRSRSCGKKISAANDDDDESTEIRIISERMFSKKLDNKDHQICNYDGKWNRRRFTTTPSPSLNIERETLNTKQPTTSSKKFFSSKAKCSLTPNIAPKPPTTPKKHFLSKSSTPTTTPLSNPFYENISDFQQQETFHSNHNILVDQNYQPLLVKNEGRVKKQIKSLFHPSTLQQHTSPDCNIPCKHVQTAPYSSSSSKNSDKVSLVNPTHKHKFQRKISFSPETISYNREDKPKIYTAKQPNPLSTTTPGQQNQTLSNLHNFDNLQDHLVTTIFQYLHSNDLCKCAMVCKRWYQLVWSPVLWSSIRIHNPRLDVDRALKCVTTALSCDSSKTCVIVENINLAGSRRLTDKGLFIVAHRCVELKKLVIDGCTETTNIAIFEIVSRCINLELLSLSGCHYITSISLTPAANLQATTTNKQIYLNHLDMTDCTNVDDSSLQMIVTYCSRLSFLYLRRCIKITDLGVQYAASYCNKLKELSVSDCPNVSDLGMRDISRLESSLKYLSVAKCRRVTDIGLKHIARKCTKIRYLNLRGCDKITEDGIIFLAAYSNKLRSIDLGNCVSALTDRSLMMLADGCQQLKRVSLKGCSRISDEGVVKFAQKLRQLQQINLIDCKVTFLSFKALHKYCDDCIIEHNNPANLSLTQL